MNIIYHIAIHDLIKTDAGFKVSLGQDNAPITPTVTRVIDMLYDLYSRRASKSHGKFAENEADYPTQGHIRDFVNSNFQNFSDLTKKMMKTLQKEAGHKGAATGGHVFFAHFEREEQHFLLVTIVTDKLGAALTHNFEVKDVTHLDIDGFRFAGRINITNWSLNGQRYVGFLKGKGDVSEYFKEFLGCDTTELERKDTADLVAALKKFTEDQHMAPEAKGKFLAKAKHICDEAAKQREEIHFQALANELLPNAPEPLVLALANPDIGLNDGFIPNRRALGALVKFRGKTKFWSIEFDREALSGGAIHYNKDDNSLTLRELPPELVNQLKSE
ncbi:nucleoid-associated protein [Thalassospira marina]|uniref:Nucleoid-associated protein n=1 Tax=Thalassospira marina TaxID=2048283 RepID=A0A2N3KYD7_9PROT|nr:nucleoid-associated protein [Thalassospira marina]PKR55486.1 hypothetical protein COO20_04770 [Thalassospira marina]